VLLAIPFQVLCQVAWSSSLPTNGIALLACHPNWNQNLNIHLLLIIVPSKEAFHYPSQQITLTSCSWLSLNESWKIKEVMGYHQRGCSIASVFL
jgi:hypothetical protein